MSGVTTTLNLWADPDFGTEKLLDSITVLVTEGNQPFGMISTPARELSITSDDPAHLHRLAELLVEAAEGLQARLDAAMEDRDDD